MMTGHICIRKYVRGFTLVELMVVVALIAILATIAIPSFRETLKNAQVTSQNNELVALITFARSEAIRRSQNVDLRLANNTGGWDAEIEVRESSETDPDATPDVPTFCRDGVLRCASNSGVDILTNDVGTLILTFNSRGYLVDGNDSTNWLAAGIAFELKHPNCAGTRQRRTVEVRPTGQITSEPKACNDT